jgi:hypothetical protein
MEELIVATASRCPTARCRSIGLLQLELDAAEIAGG